MTDPIHDPVTTLDHALAYGALGLRVLPIKPGTKRPPMREWVEAATSDLTIIRNWFTEPLYRDHGIGLAMGRQPNGSYIFALDVDEHDPANSGSETLVDLIHQYGRLPDSVRSITGSSGMHLLYSADREVRNGNIGPGLDIRGEGGQIVVAPSIHPVTAKAYMWEHGFAPWEHPIAASTGWLLDLAAPLAPPPTPTFAPTQPPRFTDPDQTDSPAEWLRQQWDWTYQLSEAGWNEHHTDRNGDVFWTRPGKAVREGESAVLHPGGPFVIWSTDTSMLVLRSVGRLNSDGSVSVSPFEFYAARRHGGDLTAAARAIRALMDPQPDSRLSGPAPGDPPPARRVTTTRASSIPMRRAVWLWDGRIPMGALSLLAGPEGLGKSTLAYWLAARVSRGELEGEDWRRPRSVLVCATEDSWSHTIAPRLAAHNADLDRIHRLDVEVDGALHAELSLPADLVAMERIAHDLDASLLILDPLMSRLDSQLDAHRDGEVRQALEPLVSSCERAKLACLGLIHHNKSGATNPLDMIMASKAFTAVARSVHTVLRDPEDNDVRLFGTIKNNLGINNLPVRTFTIQSWTYPTVDDDGNDDGMGSVGQITWGADSVTSIEAAVRAAQTGSVKGNAVDWLRDYMRLHGPRVLSSEVYAAADSADFSRRSLQRARQALGIDSEESGGWGGRRTYWFDPTDSRLSPDVGDDNGMERPW